MRSLGRSYSGTREECKSHGISLSDLTRMSLYPIFIPKKQLENEMMSVHFIEDIPFELNIDSLMKRLRVQKNSRYADSLLALVHDAQAVVKPKALFKAVYIEAKYDDRVVINGTELKSRVLRVNLEEAHRVFPYVATCGMEIDDWVRSIDDLMKSLWAETIQGIALRSALKALNKHIDEHYSPGLTSRMSPGSLKDWPIGEQRKLFAILGDTKESIGVQLTSSLMMIPAKSVSGILFPTEVSFESCQLCPREDCPGRRAPYDKDLYDRKYRKNS